MDKRTHVQASRLNTDTQVPLRRAMGVCSEHPREPVRALARPCCTWPRDHPMTRSRESKWYAPQTWHHRHLWSDTHTCTPELGHHWFGLWIVALSAPSRYLNQCWRIAIRPIWHNISGSHPKSLLTKEHAFKMRPAYGCQVVLASMRLRYIWWDSNTVWCRQNAANSYRLTKHTS